MGPMAEAEVSAKVEMGQKMKAKVSGFVGHVEGINDYGGGIVHVLLVPETVVGELPAPPVAPQWFDIDDLEPVA